MNNTILFDDIIDQKTAEKLAYRFKGILKSTFGEHEVTFNNEVGKGCIKLVVFGQGMSLLTFDVKFNNDVVFETVFNDPVPIDFLFLTSGSMQFINGHIKPLTIDSYQNVIIRNKAGESTTYKMDGGKVVKLNIIQICPKKYTEKHNGKLDFLPKDISLIFSGNKAEKIFNHFGNFNLKIADYIRQLHTCTFTGMMKYITIEGYVNIILGLQLWEYENHNEKLKLPESLNYEDIAKIQKATEYLREHIHENLTVNKLASKVHLSTPKLQKGFKLLYQKTVNNYIKELKLQAAYSYLEGSNLTVSEVVYKIGYNSRSYFTQIFYERFGILPSEYIKNSK